MSYHSLTFGTKNTWTDWHIVPDSLPIFDTPKVKTNLISIPGGDGVLDLSEALAGHPLYDNREGSFNFIVVDGYLSWNELCDTILNYLHGKRMNVSSEDDPNWYYNGRFTIDKLKSDKDNSTITITYVLDPYKIHITTGERRL